MAGTWRRLTPDKRREILRLAAQGKTQHEIAAAVDISRSTVSFVLIPLGGVIRKELWEPGGAHLTLDDRVEIRLGLERRDSFRAIARRLGRHASTVSREVGGNGGRHRYTPWLRIAAPRSGHAAPRSRSWPPTQRFVPVWSPISSSCGRLSR